MLDTFKEYWAKFKSWATQKTANIPNWVFVVVVVFLLPVVVYYLIPKKKYK